MIDPFVTTDNLSALLKLRFRDYRFVAEAAFMRPAIEIKDTRRGLVATCISYSVARQGGSDPAGRDLLFRLVEALKWDYIALIEAFEGRRPVVWG